MKKRLLSAALALAMVLTMLPLTAFAANTSVSYHTERKSTTASYSDASPTFPGWFTGSGTASDPYTPAAAGGILTSTGNFNTTTGEMTKAISGSYQGTLAHADAAKVSYYTLLGTGNTSNTLTTEQTNVRVDLNGKTLSGITMNKGGTLYIGNSAYDGTVATVATVTTVAMNAANSTVYIGKGVTVTTLTLPTNSFSNNVYVVGGTITNDLIMNGTKTVNSVTTYLTQKLSVTNGGTLGGKATLTGASSTVTVTGMNSAINGEVSVTGNSSKISVSNGTLGAVALTGLGSSMTVDNSANVGAVTLVGSTTATDKGTLPTIKVDNATVTSISRNTANEVGTPATNNDVVLTNTAKVGWLSIANGNVSITNSRVTDTAKSITLEAGSLNISGVKNNGSTIAGEVTLGAAKATDMTVSGADVNIAKITNGGNLGKLNLSGVDNTYGALALGSYDSSKTGAGTGLMNGKVTDITTFNTKWLNSSVCYRINLGTGAGNIFAGANDFQTLVDYSNKANVVGSVNVVHLGGDTTKSRVLIKFEVDGKPVASFGAYPNATIKLPATVSTLPTVDWVDAAGNHYPAGHNYVVTGAVTLSALGEYLDVTSITEVTATPDGIKAVAGTNTITLSGALELTGGSGDATIITLKVKTNDGTVNTVNVSYLNNGGTTQFTSVGAATKNGNPATATVTLDTYNNQLVLKNGTKYSLNGSGLRKMVDVELKGVTGSDKAKVEVGRITAAGYTNDDSKKTLTNTIQGSATSNTTEVNFSTAPAVLEGINAVVAALSDSQVTSWVNSAQSTQFNADKQKGANGLTSSSNIRDYPNYKGLTQVEVVAYLNMDISVYNPGATPGSITAVFTPYYKVLVTSATPGVDPVVVKTGAAIPNLGTNWGTGVSVKFNVDVTFNDPPAGTDLQAHQDGKYVYKVTKGASDLTFISLNGFAGTCIINADKYKVTRYESKAAGADVEGYYDTLQAAVDQTEEGQHLVVEAGYKPETITLSGKARTFTVNTNGAGEVKVSNATGVTVDRSQANVNEYTVQLTKDNIITANVSVAGATGGSASVNTTTAKPGDRITISLSASTGYAPSGVSVKTASGQSVSVSGSGSSYSFTMPAGATSVTVTPSFVRTTTLPFTDVPTTAWYYNGVEYCYNTIRGSARLMQGMSATTFGPNTGFTRAQVVQILWNIKGCPEPKTTYNPYTDISSIHYAYKAMLWATQNGYAEGYVDNGVRTFRPNQNVTRQEMAVFLWRAAGKPTNYNSLNLNAYADGYMVYDWAQPAMRWAIARGVLSGQSSVALGNYLSPRTVAYRSEVAVTVMNFDKLAVFR